MIIDLKKLITEERPYWTELEGIINTLEQEPFYKMGLAQIKRFHYLYQRTSNDLSRIMNSSSEPEIRRYLESVVGRAYEEIHETREKPHRLAPLHWFLHTFPRTFRLHVGAFWLSLAITLAGCAFGGIAISLDPSAKEVLMPFPHLNIEPSERVAREESEVKDRLKNSRTTFSSYLMTHNTKVSILALALGMTWGIGTVILLFINGVMLGAVVLDYILGGEAKFLAGWLLPHGTVEIPAILLAGQAGLVLAFALIGWGRPVPLKARIRKISGDLVTLISGVALMLVWAGLIEAFFSQYHEPVLPYEVKIGFGMIELILLSLFLGKSGKKDDR
ncbi:MAG: stage II sporulation protein M [Thermodesulfobacteriota bacterium]|nr:stage II sporulation protein M [Thermodesulfobacteriota bacterium]